MASPTPNVLFGGLNQNWTTIGTAKMDDKYFILSCYCGFYAFWTLIFHDKAIAIVYFKAYWFWHIICNVHACMCTGMQLCASLWLEYILRSMLLDNFAVVWLSQDEVMQTNDRAFVYIGCVKCIIDYEIHSIVDLFTIIQYVSLHVNQWYVCFIILLKILGLYISCLQMFLYVPACMSLHHVCP